MTVKERLSELGLTLPVAATPLAAYVPAVKAGEFVYVSGQVPLVEGRLKYKGTVGADLDLETAREAARVCALNCLAAAATVIDLEGVVRLVKLTGFVASTPDFHDHPKVVNGASELLQEIFGQAGLHARAAVGVSALPLGAPVEVELIIQVRPDRF
ncbi:MAG: RidA family protein [Thermodesulfobacteriota bacterium]